MPQLQASIPPLGARRSGVRPLDRTSATSVADVEFTLAITIGLVVLVIFVFLRKVWATIIPSVTVPLSLVATVGVMYVLGYSLDNLSLMALTIAVGFVVDDAIVMIENIVRYIEQGERAVQRGDQGCRADRLHHRLDHLLADRGVHPAAVHGRHHRPAVPRIRRHRQRRGGGVRLRLADADADDVLALPDARERTAQKGRFNRGGGAVLRLRCCAATTAA